MKIMMIIIITIIIKITIIIMIIAIIIIKITIIIFNIKVIKISIKIIEIIIIKMKLTQTFISITNINFCDKKNRISNYQLIEIRALIVVIIKIIILAKIQTKNMQ